MIKTSKETMFRATTSGMVEASFQVGGKLSVTRAGSTVYLDPQDIVDLKEWFDNEISPAMAEAVVAK